MKNYLLMGYGGIAKAVCADLQEAGHDILVVNRSQSIDNSVAKHLQLDLSNENCIAPLSEAIQKFNPDYVINTIGVLHDESNQPEKNITSLNSDWLMRSLKINTMPTMWLAKALHDHLKRSSELKVMTISARVSSISDDHLGGWYSYRMSKAALNMLVKNIAIEWSRQYPSCAIYGYHPGTVDTALSKPFQTNVSPDKLFTPAQASEYLLDVLNNLKLTDSGNLFDWQGKQIEF